MCFCARVRAGTAGCEMWAMGDRALAFQFHPEMPAQLAEEKIWCGGGRSGRGNLIWILEGRGLTAAHAGCGLASVPGLGQLLLGRLTALLAVWRLRAPAVAAALPCRLQECA
jgi:hypothetical protein